MNLFIILGVLFVALFVLIPLIEKSNLRMSDEKTSKISRYILPLIAVVLIIQLIMMAF
ncbi:hypothetical protein [Agaribacter marinus]|uniref:Uncharacterized protein n=1 Tax=Agaribacter marinus TaxID=1431249 RepID=A0AA37WG13_9ALTE|nr:hypothetical protein [Agaribacter marinus]GLR69526.1 hypothetical protein GCM10007852_04340 [Agaribacter marinus]